MSQRAPYFILVLAAVGGWWISDHVIIPWIDHASGYDRIENRDLSVLLGHWVFGQLPRVLVCVSIWMVAERYALMPSLRQALGKGLSWETVLRSGLVAAVILLLVTVIIGAAAGGTFGFHP